MVRVTRDAKIIDLRRDGHTYVQIGSIVGVSKSTVADAVKRSMDANGPSADQVEELRQFQGAQLDAYQAKLAPHLMRKLRNDDGEIIYDSAGDDRQPIETPDVQVGQTLAPCPRAPREALRPRPRTQRRQPDAADRRDDGRDVRLRRYGIRGAVRPPFSETIDVEGEEMSDDREALGDGSDD